jgi:hypothetical protein
MWPMHMRRPMNGLLRTAVAVVFGLMSLLHGPVMTFAKPAAAAAHHAMNAGHHHNTAPQDDPQPVEPGTMPVCYAFGCLIAVESLPVNVPAAVLEPIGPLAPGIADAMFAADVEPAVPPPRLQV